MNYIGYQFVIVALAVALVIVLIKHYSLGGQAAEARQQQADAERKFAEYEARYSPITNVEAEASRIQSAVDEMKADYVQKKRRYDELVHAVAVFDEEVELAEFGFYKPHFDFDTSEKFREAIIRVRDEQKTMIRAKSAVVCPTEWRVDRSRTQGQTMVNRATRLTARAFNGECDAAISKARWNNVVRMEARIMEAFDAINKANASLNIYISSEYLNLKLKELRLTYEYEEKKQQEREVKAELRRQEREEAQIRREAAEAAKQERKYQKLLEKAKEEAATASADRLKELETEIEVLTQELTKAQALNQRALSMAQQTRSGFVYVASNIGSFGESVYKIGMTRRLEPMDRIKELSAASVPFVFDTHVMIYSEDAPAMEAALHKAFEDRRVNKVNLRKEFFRVSIDEVHQEVERLFPDVIFVENVEARDFRETRAIEDQRLNVRPLMDALNRFPDEL